MGSLLWTASQRCACLPSINGPKWRREAALESAGCEVHGYDGSEISIKGDGGPTCLTAPIWRDDGTG
jgi:arginine deiminase